MSAPPQTQEKEQDTMKLKLDTVIADPRTGTPYTDGNLAAGVMNIINVYGREGKSKADILTAIGNLLNNAEYEEVLLTVGLVLYTALTNQYDGDAKLASGQKMKRGKFAFIVLNEDEVELEPDDVKMIRDLVEKCYATPIAYQVGELMAGRKMPTVKETPKEK